MNHDEMNNDKWGNLVATIGTAIVFLFIFGLILMFCVWVMVKAGGLLFG